MSNRLEQFVRDHRQEFDGDEPDAKVWEAIRKDMALGGDPNKKKPATVARLYRAVWGVAAAVVVLIAGTVWFLNSRPAHVTPSVAVNGQETSPPKTKPRQAKPDLARTPRIPEPA